MTERKRLYPRDLHIRLTEPVGAALARYADENYIPINGAARELLKRGLETSTPEGRGHFENLELIALGALAASEHTLELLKTIVPEGERRSLELASKAMLAAEERLNRLSRQETQPAAE